MEIYEEAHNHIFRAEEILLAIKYPVQIAEKTTD